MSISKKENNHLVSAYGAEAKTERLKMLKQLLVNNIDSLGTRWANHLPLFLGSNVMARLLWLNHVYSQSLDTPGCIVEFGCQWGASLNSLLMFRLAYEPWNASRKIIGFSTFDQGFVNVNERDGDLALMGDYATKANWQDELKKILEINFADSPTGKDGYEIVEGDVINTFPKYLEDNPHLIISHAHFDLDLYAPTKALLQLVISRMPKGGILIFDELNHSGFPGETMAVHEVLGINNLKLKSTVFQPFSSYVIL